MKINVPWEEIDNGHFWKEPVPGAEEFWALRWPVRAKVGDKITFHLDRQPIAEAVISRIEKPGESQCADTERFLNRWKVFWRPETFRKVGDTVNKQANPDFGYSHYNNREDELQELVWEVRNWGSGGFDITASQAASKRYDDPDREGLVQVGRISVIRRVRSVAEVYDPYVERGWRGTGLGQMLYDRAIAKAKNKGCKIFCSDVPKDRSGDADSAWERLKKRYPVREGAHGEFIIDLVQVSREASSDRPNNLGELTDAIAIAIEKNVTGKQAATKRSGGEVVRAYHGTRSGGFDEFRPHYRKGEQLGFGIHFAADKSFAERYAYEELTARKGKAPMVYTVDLTIHRLLLAPQLVLEGSPEFALAKQLAGSRLFTQKNEHGVPSAWMQNAIDATSGPRAEKLIRQAGYDGIQYQAQIITSSGVTSYTKHAEGVSYVVFDPSQIKIVSREVLPAESEKLPVKATLLQKMPL